MTDPGRLYDSGSSDERALLGAARSLRANTASRQRALVSLGVLSALSLAPATAIAALKWMKGVSSSALGVFGSHWGTGVVITTVAIGGAVTVQVAQSASQRDTTSPPVTAAPLRPAPAAEGSAPPAPPPIVAPPALPASPAPPPSSRSSAVRKAAATELELIDLARERLRSGNAAAALGALREHQREYPQGSLATEARVLRIEALGSSGQRAQAIKEAEGFLKQYPNGLLSHRVRRWLEGQAAR